MPFADTVITVGNTMIVAGIVLAIVLLVRAARRPKAPVMVPSRGISGLDRHRPAPMHDPGRRDEPTTVLHRDSARTSTWRSGDRWDDKAPWETGGEPPRERS